jgi:hypothetical protein
LHEKFQRKFSCLSQELDITPLAAGPYFSLPFSEITTKAASFVVSSLLDAVEPAASKFWCLPATCLRSASQLNF